MHMRIQKKRMYFLMDCVLSFKQFRKNIRFFLNSHRNLEETVYNHLKITVFFPIFFRYRYRECIFFRYRIYANSDKNICSFSSIVYYPSTDFGKTYVFFLNCHRNLFLFSKGFSHFLKN